MHIDPSNRLHLDANSPARCPHCHAQGPLAPIASPDFRSLRATRPALTGAVFQCSACGTPFLQQFRVTGNHAEHIDLQPLSTTAEQAEERFSHAYLPATVSRCFRDALGCYQHGLLQAFAAMCRLTMQAVIAERGDNVRPRLYTQVDEIAALAQLEEAELRLVRDVLFDAQSHSLMRAQDLDREVAAVLLETLKDMLQQQYVRPARLRKALRMRRYFAAAEDIEETAKVAALKPPRSAGTN